MKPFSLMDWWGRMRRRRRPAPTSRHQNQYAFSCLLSFTLLLFFVSSTSRPHLYYDIDCIAPRRPCLLLLFPFLLLVFFWCQSPVLCCAYDTFGSVYYCRSWIPERLRSPLCAEVA